MKLEVGKFYKTRDGRKVEIVSAREDKKWSPIVGYIENAFGPSVWLLDGKAARSPDDSKNDIVGEWTEPKIRWLAYLDNKTLRFIPETETPGIDWKRMPHLDEPESSE